MAPIFHHSLRDKSIFLSDWLILASLPPFYLKISPKTSTQTVSSFLKYNWTPSALQLVSPMRNDVCYMCCFQLQTDSNK